MTSRGTAVSWLEPRSDRGYTFRMALHRDGAWSDVRTITSSPDIIMFSADLPGLAELPGAGLLAYWQHADSRTGDPYATSIHVARSSDDGRTWSAPVTPHADGTVGQHGFISAFAVPDGVGLVWLDAQQQRYVPPPSSDARAAQWLGAIGLRSAVIGADGRIGPAEFIDAITCECCPTTAAVTASGPVVVYRDRVTPDGVRPADVRDDTGSVRDIHLVRFEDGSWTSPRRVHADNWVINACPDNGPSVDARGDNVVVAWWTAAAGRPRASVAFSTNAGGDFAPAIPIDTGTPIGQVTVALLADGRSAIVGWLEDGQTWARWVSAAGSLGTPVALGRSPTRARLPRWVAHDGRVLAVWTADEGGSRHVRVSQLVIK